MRLAGALAALALATPAQAADRHAILNEYVALLAIPNVATSSPDIRRNANQIMAMMAKRSLAPRLLDAQEISRLCEK